MKTIAEKTGVSVMTVSRSLRSDPSIPETTRARIRQAATQLGYTPNPLVSALMTQLRSTRAKPEVAVLCFVTNYPESENEPKNPLVESTFEGAAARARELGYKLEYLSLKREGLSAQRASKILISRGIQGIVLAPMFKMEELKFDWQHFACAAIGYSFSKPPLHRAVNDQMHSIRLAYKSLRSLGYKRIGLAITENDDQRVDGNWTAGFSVEQSYDRAPAEFIESFRPQTMDKPTFTSWLQEQRPDAILTIHEYFQDWIESAGFRVPDDIGFAHLDCTNVSHKQPSGIDQQSHQMGMLALDLVAEQLNKNERGLPVTPKTVTYRGYWRDGDTTTRLR